MPLLPVHRRASALTALAWASSAVALHAQDVLPTTGCDGRTITAVEFQPQPPRIYREVPGWTRPVLRFALGSRTTDTSAVAPFLLLEPGETCTEFQRAESERLLRAQPYIADATVSVIPDSTGGARLLVQTSDDVPLIIGGGFSDGAPDRLLLGSANAWGRGMLIAGEWERGFAYREGFGVHFQHYHAFGRRQTATLEAIRAPLSERFGVSLQRPYLTNAQRLGWHAGMARSEYYVTYPRVGEEAISLPASREVFGLAMVGRIGGTTRRLLGGVSLAHDRLTPRGDGVVITDDGLVGADDLLPVSGFTESRITRVGTVLGVRAVTFEPLFVLDSLSGRQDVPSGLLLMGTAGYEFGREQPLRDGADDVRVRHPYFGVDAYLGAAWDRGLLALDLALEGRRAPGGGWRDVVSASRVGWYRRVSARRVHSAALEYSATWNSHRPYRLTLGSWHEGVRGYGGSHVAGGRLAVLRVEERWAAGGYSDVVGFGAALFSDVGKMWATNVPFGSTTRLRVGVGAGLLVAIPRNSQALYRLDVAVPLTSDRDARSWGVRFSRQIPYVSLWRDPAGIREARAVRPEASLVTVP